MTAPVFFPLILIDAPGIGALSSEEITLPIKTRSWAKIVAEKQLSVKTAMNVLSNNLVNFFFIRLLLNGLQDSFLNLF